MTIQAKGSINVKRIDKALLVTKGENVYLDVAMFDNRDGKDKYGNDGFITQNVPKEMRDADPQRKGPIIGNWRYAEQAQRSAPPPAASTPPPSEPGRDEQPMDSDNMPF